MLNNAPPVVKNLIIINVLFYLGTMALGEYQMLHYFAGTYPGSPNFYPWQVITHMFMHGGLGHIFFNMFALYMFGGQLERLWGPQRFLNYYIICGLGGFFLHELFVGLELNNLGPSSCSQPRVFRISCGRCNWMRNLMGGWCIWCGFGILLAFGMLFPNTRLMSISAHSHQGRLCHWLRYFGIEPSTGQCVWRQCSPFRPPDGMLFGYMLLKQWQKNAAFIVEDDVG